MTDEDIALVQDSWAHVLPIADTAMEMFYERLFELDEDVAKLFAGKDMSAQRSKLADALDMVVRQLPQPDALALPLQKLGARHASYGVAEADFSKVGEALLSTLERGLIDRWTKTHAQAWVSAWEMISTQVLAGFRSQLAE